LALINREALLDSSVLTQSLQHSMDKSLVQFASQNDSKIMPENRKSGLSVRTLTLNLKQPSQKELDETSVVTAGVTDRMKENRGIVTDRSGAT
jgi:hypothetical protein